MLEIEDVPDVGAAPFVDRLVRIADDADVLVLGGQLADDPVLGAVGVLVLVDQDVAPEPAVVGERLGNLFEELHGLQQQVVEVHRARRAQPLLVSAEDEGELFLPRPARLALGVLDAEHVVLPVADALGDRARGRGALGHLELLQALLHQAPAVVLVVDDEMGRQPDVATVLAQDAHAHRVECGDHRRPDPGRQQERLDPSGHLLGGLVGERDRQEVPRREGLPAREPGDPVRDDARLAAAGAGQHEQRPLAHRDGFALRRIQVVEETVQPEKHRTIVPGDRRAANTEPPSRFAGGPDATRP